MKNLSNILIILVICCVCISCSSKVEKEEFKPTKTKIQIVEKIVPVACKIPKLDCNFSGSNFVPTQKLLECVILQKKILEDCSKPIQDITVEK